MIDEIRHNVDDVESPWAMCQRVLRRYDDVAGALKEELTKLKSQLLQGWAHNRSTRRQLERLVDKFAMVSISSSDQTNL